VGDERRGGEHPGTTAALSWHPDPTQPSVPSGAHARITANIEAIHTLRTGQAEAQPATRAEQERLSRWSSWGAVPAVFAVFQQYRFADLVAPPLRSLELAATARVRRPGAPTPTRYVGAAGGTSATPQPAGGGAAPPL